MGIWLCRRMRESLGRNLGGVVLLSRLAAPRFMSLSQPLWHIVPRALSSRAHGRPVRRAASPRAKRRRFSMTARAAVSGCVMLAMCGVIRTLGCDHNAWSGGSGSGSVTSSTASERCPPSSACSRSDATSCAPRPTCTRLAPRGSFANSVAFNTPRVASVNGSKADEHVAACEQAHRAHRARVAAHACDLMAGAAPAGTIEVEGDEFREHRLCQRSQSEHAYTTLPRRSHR